MKKSGFSDGRKMPPAYMAELFALQCAITVRNIKDKLEDALKKSLKSNLH